MGIEIVFSIVRTLTQYPKIIFEHLIDKEKFSIHNFPLEILTIVHLKDKNKRILNGLLKL